MTKIESQPEIGKETGESRPADLQALDNATYEPNGYIEQTGDFQQAEAIQTALTALVKPAVSMQEAEATPIPLPHPEEESIIGGQPKVRGDLDQATTGSEKSDATPINLPGPQPASTASEPTTGEADATPLPLPSPGEEISATPITLPGKPGAAVDSSKVPTGEEVSATPITLPGKPGAGKAARGEADDVPLPIPSPGVEGTKAEPTLIPENNITPDAGSGGEADSLPLPIPSPKGTDRPAESVRPSGMDPDPVDSMKVPTGEQVSATPITLPGKPGAGKAVLEEGPGRSEVAQDDWESPNAVRMQKGPAEVGEADSLPIPMPSPKEASPGPAIDPSMDEQLKQRKEPPANDDDAPTGK